jgi:hypothetical protein
MRVGGLVDFVGNTLHTLFETTKALAEAFAQLRQLFAAEEYEHNDREDDQMRRCK